MGRKWVNYGEINGKAKKERKTNNSKIKKVYEEKKQESESYKYKSLKNKQKA